ncbi:MAG: polymer-forming cytoskeletal family protein [Spirochaetales bacterium]|nr:MAG: polymer-forming cytoskeletal family protein [Spirochaetales bacterium]
MAKSAETKNHEKMTTTFGKTTVFKGTLKFSKPLKIDGRFEGIIESDGFLYIEEGAQVQANIRVGSIVIAGVVHGNIEAIDNLEMLPSGQVYGNVRTAKLRIADGVIFQGKCEMLKSPEAVDIFSAPAPKLKEIVKPA